MVSREDMRVIQSRLQNLPLNPRMAMSELSQMKIMNNINLQDLFNKNPQLAMQLQMTLNRVVSELQAQMDRAVSNTGLQGEHGRALTFNSRDF